MKIKIVKTRREQAENDNVIYVHYSDVGQLSDGSCELIDCEDSADYVEDKAALFFLLSKKLQNGGKLIVRGLDFISYAKNFADRRSGLADLMKRKSVSYLEEVEKLLGDFELEIVKAYLSDERYVVYAERKV